MAEQTGNCEFRKSEIPRDTGKRVLKDMRRHAFEARLYAYPLQYLDHTNEMAVTPIGWECEARLLPSRGGFDTRYCSACLGRLGSSGGLNLRDIEGMQASTLAVGNVRARP